jgi:DNA-binding response OmpR family regulator
LSTNYNCLSVTKSEQLKIIIIEDESLIAEMLKLMLEEMGHKVIGVVHTFLSRQLVIERGGCDLAMLDINLHGKMEGIELAMEL